MSTLVAVCGYSGDAHQISMLMPYYKHHGHPVMILSPEDSPVVPKQIVDLEGVDFRQGGKKAYINQDSLDRQLIHLQIMLEDLREFQWFLLHDSDSVVLADALPAYLYSEPETVWSNRICDRIPNRVRPPGYTWPELAFQPPYFFSRAALTRILQTARTVETSLVTPFIDWAMMAWTVRAGLQHRGFPEGASCGTPPGSDGLQAMTELVMLQGKFFLHAIKDPASLHQIVLTRVKYLQLNARKGLSE